MKKSTEELLSLIQSAKNIDDYLKENEEELHHFTLTEYLNQLMKDKHLRPADIMERSQKSDYVYKVLEGKRKVSRNILIAMAVGMECNLEEVQTLLRIASHARLDPRDKKDALLIYAILNHLTVVQLNEHLYDLDGSQL